MSAQRTARLTPPRRGERLLRPIEVFPWEDCGALQNYANGSLRFDWIALVHDWVQRPAWIPRTADFRDHGDGRVAFFWRDSA